jgi:hypothetical protein
MLRLLLAGVLKTRLLHVTNLRRYNILTSIPSLFCFMNPVYIGGFVYETLVGQVSCSMLGAVCSRASLEKRWEEHG